MTLELESQPTAPKTPPRSREHGISDSALNKGFAHVQITSNSGSASTHTPIKQGTHRVTTEKETVQEMRQALANELDGGILPAERDYLKTIFKSKTPRREITRFIENSPTIYNSIDERWCGIPVKPKDEKELYQPFLKLLQSIFDHFGCKNHGRVMLDTHNLRIPHKDGTNTAPDFMVMGSGHNFPPTEDEENGPSTRSYRRCVSIIEIKTQKNNNHTQNTLQVASYARQCFIEQQNRRFVYTVILTEVSAQLFIFDRAGGMRSGFFNFHKRAIPFVRIILGLYCCDNDEIGFDTSIFWEKREVKGKGADEKQDNVDGEQNEAAAKEQGEVDKTEAEDENEDDEWEGEAEGEGETAEREGEGDEYNDETDVESKAETIREAQRRQQEEQQSIAKRYDLFIRLNNHWEKATLGEKRYLVKYPLFSRDSLRGRGTKCWTVFDPDNEGRTLIIKDSWRTSIRESEAKLLAEVIGLKGVGQMVAYQDDETDRVSRFRKLTKPESIASFKELDRTFSRVALEEYGDRLEHFKDQLHLLCAFRDAVKGHRNLWERGILHRDVSLNNILFGKNGASDGNKGILIDLDMAIRIVRDGPLEGTFRTGTRAFQSINILQSKKFGKYTWPHDHLDDLESYLYCLARICCTYTEPGKVREDPEELVAWEDPKLINAVNAKNKFLLRAEALLTPYFKCFTGMFHSMGRFLYEHADRKEFFSTTQMEAELEGATQVNLTQLIQESIGHYDTFIGFIDEAIMYLSPPRTGVVYPPEPIAPSQPLNQSVPNIQIPPANDPTQPSRKRGPDEVDDCESPQKKGRLSTFSPPEH